MNDTCVGACPTIGYFKEEDTRECKPYFETSAKNSKSPTVLPAEIWQVELDDSQTV